MEMDKEYARAALDCGYCICLKILIQDTIVEYYFQKPISDLKKEFSTDIVCCKYDSGKVEDPLKIFNQLLTYNTLAQLLTKVPNIYVYYYLDTYENMLYLMLNSRAINKSHIIEFYKENYAEYGRIRTELFMYDI